MTDWNTRVLRSLLFVAVSFTIAYSANLYLLLTITAAGGGERAVNLVWRYRLVLDLVIAISAAFFPIISLQDSTTPVIAPEPLQHQHQIPQAPATVPSHDGRSVESD